MSTGAASPKSPAWSYPGSGAIDENVFDAACGRCKGKVTDLTLAYRGALEEVLVEVVQKHHRQRAKVFMGLVKQNEIFSVEGVGWMGALGSEIVIRVDGERKAKIATNCSTPIRSG